MNKCPTRFTLVQYSCGDLSLDQHEAVGTHLNQCPACRRELEAIKSNSAEYAHSNRNHLQLLKAAIDVEKSTKASSKRWWWLVPACGLAAALLIFYFMPRPQEDQITFKGAFAMQVVAKRGEQQFKVTSGTVLHRADALRFIITSDRPGFLTVLSVDARGELFPFYPETPAEQDNQPLALDSKGRHELPGSIILDEAVGPESLIAVFSSKEFSRKELHQKIRTICHRKKGCTDISVHALAISGNVVVLPIIKEQTRKP